MRVEVRSWLNLVGIGSVYASCVWVLPGAADELNGSVRLSASIIATSLG